MLKSSARPAIRLRGVRHNNLKNFDLDLPLNELIVITGLSGSGKSSLAFDTLFAEGQRRYIETFSPYARQFLDRMDKPQVDSIEGIPPAIAIEQRNSVRTTRSTVGTMTELCDYFKSLWPHIAQLHCRQCDQPVTKDSPQQIWERVTHDLPARTSPAEWLITFDVPLTEKLSLSESLALVARQGYQRLLLDDRVMRIEELPPEGRQSGRALRQLTIVQDRVPAGPANRARFVEACEQAYHFGKGKLALRDCLASGVIAAARRFSNRLHCAVCDLEYREPAPALFSFNHPVGACPTCRGFGRIISIDYDLAMPDRSRTLAEGVVKLWQSGQSAECQDDLLRMCHRFGVPTDVPFARLLKKWQQFVIDGEPGYGKDAAHEWPNAWYGLKGYFRWLESRAYKMHVRVLLSRYRAYTPCPDCQGRRLRPEALLYKVPLVRDHPGANGKQSLTLADVYQLPVRDCLRFVEEFGQRRPWQPHDPLELVLKEVRARLGYLNEVGLGYLTLDRPTRSLSGGETERVNLTTCLGTRLVNTLFVLDEPSVGLHARDTQRLVRILQQLRDAGNTVVVVEHEASVMRAADQIVDLGPGHGAAGGAVVFQGSYRELLRANNSLTGQYLSGRKQMEPPPRRIAAHVPAAKSDHSRPQPAPTAWRLNDALPELSHTVAGRPAMTLSHATRHNLRNLRVRIPLGCLVCVTGVSGSGKTTFVREVLFPALAEKLKSQIPETKASDRLRPDDDNDNGEQEDAASVRSRSAHLAGWEHLGRVALVDQAILGKTPRSNPAVYTGAFEHIRELFAQSDLAKRRGLNASAFSFNSAQGQCERCRGAGFEKIEMQFLSDVFIRCPDCQGRRYRPHILEVTLAAPTGVGPDTRATCVLKRPRSPGGASAPAPAYSIADLLDATIDEVIAFLGCFPESRPANRALQNLRWLQEVGLGYLKLGQPINTLSGGESQRLKLVRHLAELAEAAPSDTPAPRALSSRRKLSTQPAGVKPTLFLFDEPTTGLHFDDVRVLLNVFQRLVDAGHSVLVIEHNLDVISAADWVIDLGPEAGDEGGRVVAEGTPEQLAAFAASYTGQALKPVLQVARQTSSASLPSPAHPGS